MFGKNRSIVKTLMFYIIGVSCLSILIVGYFWIYQDFARFRKESGNIKEEYIESQKAMIKNEVERVVDYIYYMRSLREKRLKDSIKNRVYEAYSIALNIYNENKERKSGDEIAKMIRDALRPIRFSNGQGYYFATNLDGIEMLFADRPELEGTNMLDFQDTQGKYIIRDMLDIVRTSNEGFYEYTWTKPNEPGNDYPKIAYVKYFEPLDWFIGTGEYLDDVESGIKQEILDRIADIRFGKDGYIFVVSYDGVTLMNDTQRELIGINIWEMTDPNGVKVIQEERRAAAKPGGDFIYYEWEKPTTGQKEPKISFVRGIEEWQWMVGAGVYVDEFEDVISLKKSELVTRIRFDILKISGIIVVLLSGFFVIAWYFSNDIKKSFNVFSSFFENAATNAVSIDPEKLKFSEFKNLAFSANHMIDNRNQAESAVVESEKRFRRLFEQSYDAVFIHDYDGTINDVNDSACKILGYDKTQLLKQTMPSLIPPQTVTVFRNALLILREKGSYRFESSMLRKDGKTIDADISMREIDPSRGIIQGIVRDVTEQKYLEEQLQIRARMDSLATLAGGIAHDFNNLLAGIMGNLDLMRLNADQLSDDMKLNIEEAYHACERSAKLIKDIQYLSKGPVTDFTSVDIYTIAREVFSILERTTDKLIGKRIGFREGEYFVTGKSDQIHQVFLNLGTNAVHAIEEHGVRPGDYIDIFADDYISDSDDRTGLASGHYIRIGFQDTGAGMTEYVKSKAFDPLFSTKQRSSHKGQGLGLTMVYNIITRNHYGHIEIESTPGAGTTFIIYLPKANPPVLDNVMVPEDNLGGSETILIVEDEDSVRNVAERILQQFGFTTLSAPDGETGLEIYREHKESIDLVLLDLTMPKMSGHMMLEKLLAVDRDVKVLISSGQSADELKKLTDAKGYVTKPYQAVELVKTIRSVLDEDFM